MDLKYLTIGIKDSSINEVEMVLMELGISNYIDTIKTIFKLNITIEDNRDEFAYTSRFLAEHNLKDENPFFNDFKIESYGLKIDFELMPNNQHLDLLEPIVFILGQRISSMLKVECIVLFQNMRIPVGLFTNGVLTEVFESYNEIFFDRKIWRPQKIST
jgi:hypothetical protein